MQNVTNLSMKKIGMAGTVGDKKAQQRETARMQLAQLRDHLGITAYIINDPTGQSLGKVIAQLTLQSSETPIP